MTSTNTVGKTPHSQPPSQEPHSGVVSLRRPDLLIAFNVDPAAYIESDRCIALTELSLHGADSKDIQSRNHN